MELRLETSRKIFSFFTISLFLAIFISSGDTAKVDISFINGTWGGSDPTHTVCNTFDLKAVNQTDFTGIEHDRKPCSGPVSRNCKLSGQILGQNVSVTVDSCVPAKQGHPTPIHCTATVNSTFTSITGVTCTDALGVQYKGFSITKVISVADVSQSSGIASSPIQSNGIQWIDYNNDHRLDLFLVGSNGTQLFKNIGKGKFVDVTAQAHIDNGGKPARGASWADINNDGFPDVVITNVSGPPTLLLNQHGVFLDISNKISSTSSGFAPTAGTNVAGIWVDINNDKDIDLLVINDGASNQLFLNQGLQFKNIASSAHVDFSGHGRSAIAADFDNDGFQDFYVVNSNQPNILYHNNGNATFTDITKTAGVGFSGDSVAAAVTDFNRDGYLDLFVVNNTGSSVLYQNRKNLIFKNVTVATHLTKPKKGIAAAFFDVDNDGFQDLVLAQTAGGNLLFHNNNGKFKLQKGIDFSNPGNPTGITIGDFNNDGLPDIAFGDGQAHNSLYQNTGGGGNNYIEVTLKGKSANRAAIGTKVVVGTGLIFQSEEVIAGNGLSQSALPLEFGLGGAAVIDSIQIFWPGAPTQTLLKVKANQRLAVKQP